MSANSGTNTSVAGSEPDDGDGHWASAYTGVDDSGNKVHYTADQKRRISEYLKESDTNCKESATLVTIIFVGLLIAGSIVGFLSIRNHHSVKYRGSHIATEFVNDNTTVSDWFWEHLEYLQSLILSANATAAAGNSGTTGAGGGARLSDDLAIIIEEEELLRAFQPIYRNPLLQKLYRFLERDEEQQITDANHELCVFDTDFEEMSDMFEFVSVTHGLWIPSQRYLLEAADFSWADYTPESETFDVQIDEDPDDNNVQRNQERDEAQVKREQKEEKFGTDKHRAIDIDIVDVDHREQPGKPIAIEANAADNDLKKDEGNFDVAKSKLNTDAVVVNAGRRRRSSRRLLNGAKNNNKNNNNKNNVNHANANLIHKRNPKVFPKNNKNKYFKKGKNGNKGNGGGKAGIGFNFDFDKLREKRLAFLQKRNKEIELMNQRMKNGKNGNKNRKEIENFRTQFNKERIRQDLAQLGVLSAQQLSDANEVEIAQEIELDLEQRELEDEDRHPYMTLLLEPGFMTDIQCLKQQQRRHRIHFVPSHVLHDNNNNNNNENENENRNENEDKNEENHFDLEHYEFRERDASEISIAYKNNMLLHYCYLVQIDESMDEEFAHLHGSAVRIAFKFTQFKLERGHDFVDIYVNSERIRGFSGDLFHSWAASEQAMNNYPRVNSGGKANEVVYYIDAEYIALHGHHFELCLKIVTDESIVVTAEEGGGFEGEFSVDLMDPQFIQWTEWSDCFTKPPRGKDRGYYTSVCGVGVHTKSVSNCSRKTTETEETETETEGDADSDSDSEAEMADKAAEKQKEKQSRAYLQSVCEGEGGEGETRTEYCFKENQCGDVVFNPPDPTTFLNGNGRIDPAFADPFAVQRARNERVDFAAMLDAIVAAKTAISARYPDIRILTHAVTPHEFLADSRLRLGIRLARSLLLGDTFTAVFTGSSNTAGHQNLFLSTYPLQLQALLRPLWKEIGYKGAAFVARNSAIGGAPNTGTQAPCIPQMAGDDADVVYWESIMNDHGAWPICAFENHVRNAISLPRRPLYHVMFAGKRNGVAKFEDPRALLDRFSKAHAKQQSKQNKDVLESQYIDFGAGFMQFKPGDGINPASTLFPERFAIPRVFISWHPGTHGHRMYGEMIAYEYLSSVQRVLLDMQPLLEPLLYNDENDGTPIAEMLEILEDPPRRAMFLSEEGIGGLCGKFCTNASTSHCLTGYQPLAVDRFEMHRWVANPDTLQWTYANNANQPLWYERGGQSSNDIQSWLTSTAENPLDLYLKSNAKKLVNMQITLRPPDIALDLFAVEPELRRVRSDMQCETGGWFFEGGCAIEVPEANTKYILRITTKKQDAQTTLYNVYII